jgi:hypothetical protein
MKRFRIAVLLISVTALACAVQAEYPQAAPTPDLAPATSLGVVETASPTVAQTVAPPATATSAPFVPFTVTTWASNVLLHDNPGHLASKLGILPDNTPLTVLGRAPGSEWLMVKTADNRLGWVFSKLVESSGPDIVSAPLVEPTGVLMLRGRLTDIGGGPITGIQFAVLQVGVSDERRTDAMTDADGIFHAFLPADSKGSWWVEYVAISCDSNVMDATCTNWTGEPDPKGTYVQLPGGSYSPLKFVWK